MCSLTIPGCWQQWTGFPRATASIECVLLLQNVFSYYRMCSLTIPGCWQQWTGFPRATASIVSIGASPYLPLCVWVVVRWVGGGEERERARGVCGYGWV